MLSHWDFEGAGQPTKNIPLGNGLQSGGKYYKVLRTLTLLGLTQ